MSDSTAIFRQACLAEVTDRIRNQVLVNRLTATSSNITKISWLEMLVNYRRIDVDCLDKCHAWRFHVNMYNLNDFVCCIPQIKGGLWTSFHQSTKFPTNIDKQTLLYGTLVSMCNWFQNTHPYICSGLGYLGWQLSRAMLFQRGLANRKCPVRQLSATTSSLWRTLWPSGRTVVNSSIYIE